MFFRKKKKKKIAPGHTVHTYIKTKQKFTRYISASHQNAAAPLADRELSGKRKRARTAEEDHSAGDGVSKARGEENVCPNGVKEKATPVRKVRGQAKSCQKLFANGAGDSKAKEAGEEAKRF